jgi:hypothetical protein
MGFVPTDPVSSTSLQGAETWRDGFAELAGTAEGLPFGGATEAGAATIP